jgi:hypothetical protein
LKNIEIFEKQSATFECEINKPNQVAEWKIGADVVTPAVGQFERFVAESDGNVHRLTVQSAEKIDAAKYSCHTKDKKTSATLTVNGE